MAETRRNRLRLPLEQARLLAVLVLALVMAGLVLAHVKGVNGPWYWYWSWRRLASLPLYASMLVAAAPFFAAQVLLAKKRIGRRTAMALVMLATLLLQLAASFNQPPYGPSRMTQVVQNTVNTSYYTAATWVHTTPTADWLAEYPTVITDYFHMLVHARFKPPGQTLYYVAMIKLFGVGNSAAIAGAMLIALIATLAVPATDWLIRFYSGDAQAGWSASSFIALCPSLVLFFPQFDQTYPAIACVVLVLWGRALRRGRLGDGLAFGLALGGALFLSWIFLVLGMFLAVLTLLHAGERGRRGLRRVASQSLLAILGVGLFYGVLYAWARYDAITTFLVTGKLQEADLVKLSRPFPLHIVFDVYDIMLGIGWIGGLLILFYVARSAGPLIRLFSHDPPTRLAFLALLQVATVAAAALLPGESARLWLPMFPLLMVPIGFELRRWPARDQLIVYACLLAMTILIAQNLTFIYMGPEFDGPR